MKSNLIIGKRTHSSEFSSFADNAASHWSSIPFSLQCHIAQYLDKPSRAQMANVNRAMRLAVEHTTRCLMIKIKEKLDFLQNAARFNALDSLTFTDFTNAQLERLPTRICSIDILRNASTVSQKGINYLGDLPLAKLHLSDDVDTTLADNLDFSRLHLSVLNVSQIRIPDTTLASILLHCPLQSLRLSGVSLNTPNIIAISALPQLRQLNLRFNPLGIAAVNALAQNHHLDTLKLEGTGIDDQGVQQLCTMPSLTKLNLCYNDQMSVQSIAMLAANVHLRSLSFEPFAIPPNTLITHFTANSTLTRLTLRVNDMESDHIAALWNNATLKRLTIKTDKGATLRSFSRR